jgi:hypothetical protein
MMIYNWLFGKENKKSCDGLGCKLKQQEKSIAEFVSELNLLKAKFNDLELDYIELENINVSLSSDNEELKTKNSELISVLLKVSDIAKVSVECNKKVY